MAESPTHAGAASTRSCPIGSKDRDLARGSEPSWSADGRRIVFARMLGGTNGQSDVFSMRADGSGVRRITHTEASESAPAYALGGKRIVFNQINSKGKGPFIVSARASDGSHRDRLAVGRDPNPSPDGKQIVYSKGSKQDQGIWTMRADGSHKRQLTRPGRSAPMSSRISVPMAAGLPSTSPSPFTQARLPRKSGRTAPVATSSAAPKSRPLTRQTGRRWRGCTPGPKGDSASTRRRCWHRAALRHRRLTNRFNSEAPDPSWQPK